MSDVASADASVPQGLTFGDEVEHIWKQNFTAFTVLWALLRYIPPLMEVVVLDSLFDPSWSFAVCSTFALSFFLSLTRITRHAEDGFRLQAVIPLSALYWCNAYLHCVCTPCIGRRSSSLGSLLSSSSGKFHSWLYVHT